MERGWDGIIEYSTDKKIWTEWDGTEISSGTDNKLYFRGSGNTKVSNNSTWNTWEISATSGVSCTGNIENLLDYETVANGEHPTMATYCYSLLFNWNQKLITAPDLPAPSLTSGCYYKMFQGCALETAPELPATTLANACYEGMFQECKSLITAPELLATTMAERCYAKMFQQCSALIDAPKMDATDLAFECCYQMFQSCYNLSTIPLLRATTMANRCYYEMFHSCGSLKFSTTQTAESPNAYRIPTSGTGTIATNWSYGMFANTGGTFTDSPSINTTYYTAAVGV